MKPANRRLVKWILLLAFQCLTPISVSKATSVNTADTRATPPMVLLPRQALGPEALGIIVNDLDPKSQQIAHYYAAKRGVPTQNLIPVRFAPGRPVMRPKTFQAVYQQVRAATPEQVQAYVLTWTVPFRVGCMSITTAFAAGFDKAFCAVGCKLTRHNPYFASGSERPFAELGWRPTMALAGADFAAVKALIDRGIAADDSRPAGTAYLLDTSDQARNVRAQTYDRARQVLGGAVRIERIKADHIAGKPDVLFYLTGLKRVPKITTNHFLPGAAADHLTSSGGRLTGSRQMSSLRWLDAGATGSYGAVVEPCNLLPKFPNPIYLIAAYVSGATLLEAYWKSVQMPGQGIFIGEPLARPFGGYAVHRSNGRWVLETYALRPGRYQLQGAQTPVGPYRTVDRFTKPGFAPLRLALPDLEFRYYRVVADATAI